jgi:hypothetical protein
MMRDRRGEEFSCLPLKSERHLTPKKRHKGIFIYIRSPSKFIRTQIVKQRLTVI